jgi:oligogalacturonide lyase
MEPWTRRSVLCLPMALKAAEPPQAEFLKFRDPATEFEVVRVTDPAYSSYLSPAHLHPISRRNSLSLISSDRSGSLQIWRMDLRSQEARQISEAKDLDHSTVSFLPEEHGVIYFDGRSLVQIGTTGGRQREIYSVPEAWNRLPGLGMSDDGVHSMVVEESGGKHRLRLIAMGRGTPTDVLQDGSPIRDPMPRPKRAGILYRKDNGLWLVNYDGQQNRRLKTAPGGTIGPALWSTDGRTVLYLIYPDDTTKLNQLRELTPDTNEDKAIGNTSQFVNFAHNADSSVFVGVSRSKASPFVLLLLRVTHRELTVCEHKASKAEDVVVHFSPNSQRLYYHSDRNGKSVVYSMLVEKFVEKTDL